MPELVRWTGDDRPVDVTIRLGDVPHPQPGANWISNFVQVNPDKSVRVAAEDAAHFLARDGKEITVAPIAAVDSQAVRIYLLGTMLTTICHQRGIFPLHGSCVAWGAGAVTFVGVSGAGKSTMAAVMRSRGHSVLSDDVCAIDLSSAKPLVVPAFPRLKLWGASLPMVGIETDGSVAQRESDGKYHFRFTEGGEFDGRPLPLSAICLLETAEPGAPARVDWVEGAAEKLAAISTHVPRRRIAHALGRQGPLFVAAAKLASSIPVIRLTRCAEPERIEETLFVLSAALEKIQAPDMADAG